MFKEIIKWNEIAWFTSDNLNRHLETSMLMEEVSELIIAMKNKDKVEMLDWFADIIFVLTWLMYKHWFTDKQLELWIKEVIRSNYSKFVKEWDEYKVIRDEGWKIMKPKTFSEPDLESILSNEEETEEETEEKKKHILML